MRKLLRRIVILVPAVILQLVWLRLLFTWLSPWAGVISFALSNLSLLVVLYITIRLGESTYKVLWLLVVLTFPLPGTERLPGGPRFPAAPTGTDRRLSGKHDWRFSLPQRRNPVFPPWGADASRHAGGHGRRSPVYLFGVFYH